MTAEPTDGAADRRAAGRPAPVRPAAPVVGLLALAVGAGLAAAASVGPSALAVGVVLLQLTLVVALVGLLDTPAPVASLLIGLLATGLAVAAAVMSDGEVAELARGIAGCLGVALLVQLSWRRRSRVTVSLLDTLAVVVLVSCAACLVALAELPGGADVLVTCLVAAALTVFAGRLGDWLAPRPRLMADAARSWAGLVVAVVVGVAGALVTADRLNAPLDVRAGWLVGLSVVLATVAADLAGQLVDGDVTLRGGAAPPRWAGTAVAVTVPFAMLGPIALLAGRLAPA